MGVTPELLERDMKIIRDRRGPEAIHKASEQAPVDRISTGILGIDRITSGGIPIGRMTRFWGGPSSGKTILGYYAIRAAQRLKTKTFPNGMEINYCNIEKQLDSVFAAELGVDIDRMNVLETTVIEDIAREVELLLHSIHFHMIDSCSFAVSQDELNSDPGDWHVGLDARVWKKCLNRLNSAMDADQNIIVYVDHASQDLQSKSEHALGGKRMEHASSMSIHFVKGAWLFYDEDGVLEREDKLKEKGHTTGYSGFKEADGVEIQAKVAKSRVCRPFRTARLRLDLNTFQFDRLFELTEAAKFFDSDGGLSHRTHKPAIAQQTSAKSSWYDVGGKKAQGSRGLRTLIEEDPKLSALVETAMMAGN